MFSIHSLYRQINDLGSKPSRLIYDEAPPAAPAVVVTGNTRETYVSDVLKTANRRAMFTRQFLEGNGFTADDFKDMMGKTQVPLAEDFRFRDDKHLVRAVLDLQAKLGFKEENSKEGQDGMFGKRTFEALDRLLHPSGARSELKEKVETFRRERVKEEGEKISYRDNIEGSDEHRVTAQVLTDAEKECEKGGEFNDILKRGNLLKVADYVGKQIDVPPSAILAIALRETSGRLSMEDYGDEGVTLGMGQLNRETWGKIRNDEKFQEVMGKFTEMDPTTIGRARSIMADLLGIGMRLKKASDVMGVTMTHDSELSADDLINLRFYYHVPGYAKAVKAGRSGEYAEKAQAWFQSHKGRYEAYAKQVGEFYAALKK